MRIDNSKQTNQNETARTRQLAAGQNNFEENFRPDSGDAPYGDFANIFESVVNRDKEKDSDDKTSTKESKVDDKETEKLSKDHKRVSEKKDDGGTDDSNGNAETNAGLAAWRMNGTETSAPNLENINARAILHIADIEKIVSSVRTQLSDLNLPQVVIQLKNSVLEGLQIKLSNDINGKVIAEFVSKSEKARLQVEAKTKELSDILHNRGIQISTIKTSLADSSTDNQDNRKERNAELQTIKTKTSVNTQTVETEEVVRTVNNNSYRV